MSKQYYGIENLGLTAGQKQTLVDALQKLRGRNVGGRPDYINHWRVRPDGEAIIFEGNFDDDDWTVNTVKNRLANLFGIDPSLITSTTQQTQYGPMVTFSRAGNRLRMIAFGGLLATWEQSHDAVLAYLAANAAEWGNV